MNPILFLDIDFVLNSHLFELKRAASNIPYIPHEHEIDPACVLELVKILNQVPNLKIVISSAWRESLSLKDFQLLFAKFGIKSNRIIDVTQPGIKKDESIRCWLCLHPETPSYVILDDDALFDQSDPLYAHFYRVPTVGLKERDVSKILLILG